jgi:hypothetical protein
MTDIRMMHMNRIVMLVLVFMISSTTRARGQVDSTLVAAPLGTEPERHTKGKTGMKTGLIVCGIAGASLALLVAAYSDAECDGGDCSDVTALGYVGAGLLGATLGGLTGALVGYVFGSMIPDHPDQGSIPEESQGLPGPLMERKPIIASISLQPGVAVLTERPEDETGFSVRAALLAQPKRWLGIGPEIAYTDLAGGVFELGGAVSVGPREPGLRPYLIGNLGWQQWKTGINAYDTNPSVLTAGFGGGLSFTPGSGSTHLGLETRYHWSPQNIPDREGYRFVSTSAVFRHSW